VRGASALADLLAAHPDVVPLIVWEPVLSRDKRPKRRLRRQMPEDASQFWDPHRSLSDAIVAGAKAAGADDAVPDDGIVWDVVFLYRPGRTWPADGAFPLPDWWGAPVVNAVGPLREELRPSPEVPEAEAR
jgi:hypothetical protein